MIVQYRALRSEKGKMYHSILSQTTGEATLAIHMLYPKTPLSGEPSKMNGKGLWEIMFKASGESKAPSPHHCFNGKKLHISQSVQVIAQSESEVQMWHQTGKQHNAILTHDEEFSNNY